MTSSSSELRRARPLLGTIVEIGATGARAATAIDAAFMEIETIHRLMSFHDSASDVSRLNLAPPQLPVSVDRRTYEVLAFAQSLSRLSGGAFDVTVGAALVEGGFLPTPAQSALPPAEATYADVLLLPGSRVMLRRRAWIDLGGIAKGYAVDRAVSALQWNGARTGIVNAGGDLRVFGAALPIHVRHPDRPRCAIPIGPIENAAVASSSGSFARIERDNEIKEPLINPGTRRGERWRGGVTVLAPDCMSADALTKVIRLAPRRARTVLARFRAQAIVFDRRGARLLNLDQHWIAHARQHHRSAIR